MLAGRGSGDRGTLQGPGEIGPVQAESNWILWIRLDLFIFPGMLELAFRPDRRRQEPVYRQLAGYLRDLVAAGRLGEGQKLPATRELAAALGLSRNTVNQAYDALAAERLVTAHVGQGTFVSAAGRARASDH